MLNRLILVDRACSRKDSLQNILKEDFDLDTFSDAVKAIEGMRGLPPHGIIIVDEEHPSDTLRTFREAEVARDLPIIVVATDPTPEKEVAAFEAGADEFLSKDSDPRVFKIRILGIIRQIYTLKQLKSKLEEMDFFVQTVTHDLKNPIGSILSTTELLESADAGCNPAEKEELLGTIRKCGENALDFIQDLLSLLRNSTRLQDVAEVSARELIATTLEDLSSMIGASGAVISIPETLPAVVCDRRRMVQVFTNIIGNAIKYVPKGVRPKVKIEWIETPHANTFVFADNGIGMDAKDVKKIFQAFTRLPDACEYKGTGLGLSIVQRIVESHEGEVFAMSRKGIGSEFYVVIPTQLSFQSQLQSQE